MYAVQSFQTWKKNSSKKSLLLSKVCNMCNNDVSGVMTPPLITTNTSRVHKHLTMHGFSVCDILLRDDLNDN